MSDKISAVEMRACASCKFSGIHRAPPELFKMRVCKRFPPSVVLVPGPQTVTASAWPVVADEAWCYEYAPEGAANG